MKGKIKNIISDRGFGFIQVKDSNDIYFNVASLGEGLTLEDIQIGDKVVFEIKKQRGGREAAANLRILDDESVVFFKDHVLDLHKKKDQYDDFCKHAEMYAKRLKGANRSYRVTTSMIRKIYARILNARSVPEIKQLRPHFAYTAGRNEKLPMLREFMSLLDYLAKAMELDNEQQLDNYKQFMEAIVAYRKYVGDDK